MSDPQTPKQTAHNLHYKFRDREYHLPWTRPDMDRLKLWYREMTIAFPSLEKDFHIFLFGKFWSSHAPNAGHVDLYVVPEPSTSDEPTGMLTSAIEIVERGFQIGLADYRLGVDLAIATQEQLAGIHQQTLEIELEERTEFDQDPTIRTVLCKPLGARYFDKKKWYPIISYPPNPEVEQETGLELTRRDCIDFKEATRLIQNNNLIFYKPVELMKLFAPIDTLIRTEA